MSWCAGVLSGSLATCPNMALRPLIIRSDTGAKPVRKETSEFMRTKSCHLIPRIRCYSNHITTQISIQTAGLAFGGTGLCSYRVRGVDGSCTEHLTVESFTIIHAANSRNYYPRESEGLCFYRRWFVCLSVCLSVCYHNN